MRDVFIVGRGETPVTRHGPEDLRHLGAEAVRAALRDAGAEAPTALYVGNMLSGMLSVQQQLGALIAHEADLPGIEAATVEAACGSGGAAARWGIMAIQSGAHDLVVVCGVERMTHAPKELIPRSLAAASDWEAEGSRGETFVSLNARLMQVYLEAYHLEHAVFAPFAINAHRNATRNPHALFKDKPITEQIYRDARHIEGPLKLYDVSPVCDGAAAIVLASGEVARELRRGRPLVRVRASSAATDTVGLAGRKSLLRLDAVARSARRAYEQAGVALDDIDLFECHDAYSIMAALSLEAAGFAEEGKGYALGLDGAIFSEGRIPLSTMGGLKGRGHPVGATGVYQLSEACAQLCGEAGGNQIPNAAIAMTQNFGGTGATVVTHILERVR